MASPQINISNSFPRNATRFTQNDASTKKIQANNCTNARKSVTSASKFEQQMNFPEQDLEAIRKMLCAERANQESDKFKFWTPDFERMMVDDWLVTRFLLRGAKAANKRLYSINRGNEHENIHRETMKFIKLCAAFRLEYRINGLTRESEFPIEWTSRNGLIKHQFDLAGNPVVYLRIKLHRPKLIEAKTMRHQFKRLLLFTLEDCDKELLNKPGNGICCVFDMSEATFENVDLELLTWMIKSFKSCGPKLLSYMIVYNLPWIFNATFKLISNTILSNSSKQSLRFVYGDEIFNFISCNNLPAYLKDTIN